METDNGKSATGEGEGKRERKRFSLVWNKLHKGDEVLTSDPKNCQLKWHTELNRKTIQRQGSENCLSALRTLVVALALSIIWILISVSWLLIGPFCLCTNQILYFRCSYLYIIALPLCKHGCQQYMVMMKKFEFALLHLLWIVSTQQESHQNSNDSRSTAERMSES